MKIPQAPPPVLELLAEVAERRGDFVALLGAGEPVDGQGRYLHWDELRWRTPPDGLTPDTWWMRTAFSRLGMARFLPFSDVNGEPFRFSNVDAVQELVHGIDQQASGQIMADEMVMNPQSSDRYLVSSLHEEAITSSQLEGASTTRRVAKEMLESGRRPRDRSEQMILNNFHAMEAAADLAASGEPLTPQDVLDLHRAVTHDTLDDERDAGRLQGPDDERIAVVWPHDGTVVHQPPPAEELPGRLELLCDFANGRAGEGFIHPVVRAILLHFALAYDHPFADGNGRTARALFYWSMLRSGYWLARYLAISSILRGAPAQYARSYLHVETDGGDVTYFVLHQLRVIERAIASLGEYLERKMEEQRLAERLLRDRRDLNHRQHALVADALSKPDAWFTIQTHGRRHRIAYATARGDLLGLEAAGLFVRQQSGRQFVFRPSRDLAALLRADD